MKLCAFIRAFSLGLALFLISGSSILADQLPFKIGVFLCQSGACADWGDNALKGIELAVEEINASGGILDRKLIIELQDTKEADNASSTVSAFQSLSLDKEIKYFIGPTWSTGCRPLIPIISKMPDVIVTSPSVGIADFNEGAENIFNLWPHDDQASRALARLAIQKGWTKAAILSAQNAWDLSQADVFEDEFKKLKGVVVSRVEPLSESPDFRSEVAKIKADSPDVVFMTNYGVIPKAAKDFRKVGYKGVFLSVVMDESIVKESANSLEGAVFTRYESASKDFQEAFKGKYGRAPGQSADTAYDAVYLYAKGIPQARTFDAQKVSKILPTLSFDGASGRISFDGKRGVRKAPEFFWIKNGEFEKFDK